MEMHHDFKHPDLLEVLNNKVSITEKIESIHTIVKQYHPFLDRIAIAIYDTQCDMVKIFAHSTIDGNPLANYQEKLADSKSLREIHEKRRPRVINNITPLQGDNQEHTQRLLAQGFISSYTVPMYQNEEFTGFIFFNSRRRDVFREENLAYLDMIARVLCLLVGMELNQVKTLQGALRTATCFTSHRDPETGAHLERMARFSRLIASEIGPHYGMNDEMIEAIFWFAPMHDVGKIAIPDHILLKPSKLTEEEFAIMKRHTTKGKEILDTMILNFNLSDFKFEAMLKNIAEFHHENIDGSGYPQGLKGENIPIEARIVAVADVFDALTSKRTYKEAWDNKQAFAELHKLSKWKLDPECVRVLSQNKEKVAAIQKAFQDTPLHHPEASETTRTTTNQEPLPTEKPHRQLVNPTLNSMHTDGYTRIKISYS